MKKILILTSLIFTFSLPLLATGMENSTPTVIGQEVTGKNLQQLEYQKITNKNDALKNQRIESTNMEIVGDSLKRQRQRIKVIQSDSITLEEEVITGKKKGFFSTIFGW